MDRSDAPEATTTERKKRPALAQRQAPPPSPASACSGEFCRARPRCRRDPARGTTTTAAVARATLPRIPSGHDGVELRVRGGGRTFEVDIDDGTRNRNRQVTRRGPVPTAEAWATVRVPFAAPTARAHGERVTIAPLDLAAMRSIGLYIIDGQDGLFRLEVDWIRAYREAD
ncbi:MAG: CIA30 family protein [Bacteroidota bacterium]